MPSFTTRLSSGFSAEAANTCPPAIKMTIIGKNEAKRMRIKNSPRSNRYAMRLAVGSAEHKQRNEATSSRQLGDVGGLEQSSLILLNHLFPPRFQYFVVDRIGRREEYSVDAVRFEPFDLGHALRRRAGDRKALE